MSTATPEMSGILLSARMSRLAQTTAASMVSAKQSGNPLMESAPLEQTWTSGSSLRDNTPPMLDRGLTFWTTLELGKRGKDTF